MCDGAGQFLAGNADKVILASTAVSGVANLLQGGQQRRYYNYQADQSSADAEAERQLGVVRGEKVRKAGRLQQSEVTAGFGGSGIDVGSGSAIAVRGALQRNIEEDALTQLLTGQRRGRVLDATAQGQRSAGENAMSGGYMSAARSLLTGTAASMDAANNRSKWIRKQQQEQTALDRVAGTGPFSYDQEFMP